MVWEASDSWALDDLLEDQGHRRQVPIMVASFEAGAAYRRQKSHGADRRGAFILRGLCRQTSPDLIPCRCRWKESLYAQLEIAFILLWHKRPIRMPR